MNSLRKVKNDPEDRILVEGLIADSEQDFNRIYDKYKNVIYGYSFKFLHSSVYAQEIVQEVFLKIWKHRHTLDPKLSFKSYIFKIARNQVLNFLRKATYEKNLAEEIFYQSQQVHNQTENEIISKDYNRILDLAIQSLPARRKLIYQMCRHNGLSHEEIATQLGLSKNTVKDQIVKALKSIRHYLKTHADISLLLFYLWLERLVIPAVGTF